MANEPQDWGNSIENVKDEAESDNRRDDDDEPQDIEPYDGGDPEMRIERE